MTLLNSLLAHVVWADHEGAVVRRGVLRVNGREMRCYVLASGERLIDVDDLAAFFAEVE